MSALLVEFHRQTAAGTLTLRMRSFMCMAAAELEQDPMCIEGITKLVIDENSDVPESLKNVAEDLKGLSRSDPAKWMTLRSVLILTLGLIDLPGGTGAIAQLLESPELESECKIVALLGMAQLRRDVDAGSGTIDNRKTSPPYVLGGPLVVAGEMSVEKIALATKFIQQGPEDEQEQVSRAALMSLWGSARHDDVGKTVRGQLAARVQPDGTVIGSRQEWGALVTLARYCGQSAEVDSALRWVCENAEDAEILTTSISALSSRAPMLAVEVLTARVFDGGEKVCASGLLGRAIEDLDVTGLREDRFARQKFVSEAARWKEQCEDRYSLWRLAMKLAECTDPSFKGQEMQLLESLADSNEGVSPPQWSETTLLGGQGPDGPSVVKSIEIGGMESLGERLVSTLGTRWSVVSRGDPGASSLLYGFMRRRLQGSRNRKAMRDTIGRVLEAGSPMWSEALEELGRALVSVDPNDDVFRARVEKVVSKPEEVERLVCDLWMRSVGVEAITADEVLTHEAGAWGAFSQPGAMEEWRSRVRKLVPPVVGKTAVERRGNSGKVAWQGSSGAWMEVPVEWVDGNWLLADLIPWVASRLDASQGGRMERVEVSNEKKEDGSRSGARWTVNSRGGAKGATRVDMWLGACGAVHFGPEVVWWDRHRRSLDSIADAPTMFGAMRGSVWHPSVGSAIVLRVQDGPWGAILLRMRCVGAAPSSVTCEWEVLRRQADSEAGQVERVLVESGRVGGCRVDCGERR